MMGADQEHKFRHHNHSRAQTVILFNFFFLIFSLLFGVVITYRPNVTSMLIKGVSMVSRASLEGGGIARAEGWGAMSSSSSSGGVFMARWREKGRR
jgi:hypothetical protein